MAEPNRIDKQTMVMDIRQLIPLDEAESYFLCLNRNTWLLVQMLHSFYGSWRNRYSQNVDIETPIQPTDEQWNLVMDIFDRGEMELTQVTCLDDLVSAIEGITAQLSVSSASGDCGCVVDSGTSITDLNDSLPQDIPEGEEFPPGFEDREDFDFYRCKAATKIFDDYLNTLRNWGGLTGMVGGLTVAVMVGLALLTIPPVGLTILLAALGTLLGIDAALFANLTLIANGMDDNRDDIICEIYNAASTSGAVSAIRDAASAEVTELDLGILEATFLTITDNLISNEAFAVLTTKDATIDGLPGEDCSGCAPEGLFFIDLLGGEPAGVLIDGDLLEQGTIESSPLFFAGGTRQIFILQSTGEPQDNFVRIDSVLSNSGATNYTLDCYDDSNTLIFSDTVSNLADFVGFESPALKIFTIRDSTDFTSTFEVQLSFSETAF